jgi:hypothetical protein
MQNQKNFINKIFLPEIFSDVKFSITGIWELKKFVTKLNVYEKLSKDTNASNITGDILEHLHENIIKLQKDSTKISKTEIKNAIENIDNFNEIYNVELSTGYVVLKSIYLVFSKIFNKFKLLFTLLKNSLLVLFLIEIIVLFYIVRISDGGMGSIRGDHSYIEQVKFTTAAFVIIATTIIMYFGLSIMTLSKQYVLKVTSIIMLPILLVSIVSNAFFFLNSYFTLSHNSAYLWNTDKLVITPDAYAFTDDTFDPNVSIQRHISIHRSVGLSTDEIRLNYSLSRSILNLINSLDYNNTIFLDDIQNNIAKLQFGKNFDYANLEISNYYDYVIEFGSKLNNADKSNIGYYDGTYVSVRDVEYVFNEKIAHISIYTDNYYYIGDGSYNLEEIKEVCRYQDSLGQYQYIQKSIYDNDDHIYGVYYDEYGNPITEGYEGGECKGNLLTYYKPQDGEVIKVESMEAFVDGDITITKKELINL